MQTDPQVLKAQAEQIANGLAQLLQPAEIGLFLSELIAASTTIIRNGCDHGCSLAFLALLDQDVEEQLAAETELVPAASVSPEIAQLLLEILGDPED